MNVAILTPLELERNAVLTHLNTVKIKFIEGDLYYTSHFLGQHASFNIIVHQTQSKEVNIALAAEKLIRHFKPQIVFLTGIAGGIKDVELGDLVIGTKAYAYESGKEKNDGFKNRPEVFLCNKSLLTLAEFVNYENNWRNRIKSQYKTPKVYFGPIASGNKVIVSRKSKTFKIIKKFYNDALAIEMEGAGLGASLYRYPNVSWINIRGISDTLDNKNEQQDKHYQPIVADYAAAFIFEMIYQLDTEQINLSITNVDELAEELALLIQYVSIHKKPHSELNKQLADSSDFMLRHLWNKIKPAVYAGLSLQTKVIIKLKQTFLLALMVGENIFYKNYGNESSYSTQ